MFVLFCCQEGRLFIVFIVHDVAGGHAVVGVSSVVSPTVTGVHDISLSVLMLVPMLF
jgi:hypothetical protein